MVNLLTLVKETFATAVLTGVMENFTRSLPHGGEIQVEVKTAGDRLKLELVSQSSHESHWLSSSQFGRNQKSLSCFERETNRGHDFLASESPIEGPISINSRQNISWGVSTSCCMRRSLTERIFSKSSYQGGRIMKML